MATDDRIDGDEQEKAKSLDISPTAMAVIVVALALPVDLYITHLGNAEKGRAAFVLIAATAATIMFRWNLRRRWWFWAVIFVLVAIETYLLQRIHWYKGSLPPVSLLPLAIVLMLIQFGFLGLARLMFARSPR